jgi:hypothetical protein
MVAASVPHENLHTYRDDKRWLAVMEPLRDWTNEENADEQTRSDGYTAATRYARALAVFVPAQDLWPPEQLRSWQALEQHLAGRGAEVDRLLALLDEDVAIQRLALTDLDADGLLTIVEEQWDLDPLLADTDGDGWPDGVIGGEIPDGARILANDGRTHCSGMEYGPDASPRWTVGTVLGVRRDLSPESKVADGSLIRVPHALGSVPGPVWYTLTARDLERSFRCVESDYLLMHTTEDEFVDLLDPLMAEFRIQGFPGWRLEVLLGGPETRFGNQIVLLSKADVQASLVGGIDGLARLLRLYWSDAEDRGQARRDLLVAIAEETRDQERLAREQEAWETAYEAKRARRNEAERLEWEQLFQEAEELEKAARLRQAEQEAEQRREWILRAKADLEAREQRAARRAREAAEQQVRMDAEAAEQAELRAVMQAEWDSWLQANAAEQAERAASGKRRNVHPIGETGPRIPWSDEFEAEDVCVALLAAPQLPSTARCDSDSGVLIVPVWSGVRNGTVTHLLGEVIGNPTAPVRVELGSPTTTITDVGVHIARSEVDWAQRNARLDVLVALASILINYLEMGLPPDPLALNDELAIEVGYGVREVSLE